MFDLSFLQILTRAIAGIVVLSVMGLGVAAFARLLGDRGVRHDGKLTLNPIAHIDIFALIATVIARTGWIRPIAIDPAACRLGRIAPTLIAVLALVTVLVFGRIVLYALPWVATYWPTSSAAFVDTTIRMTADIAAWTVALNLIPIPPFLGGYLLQSLAPQAHSWLVQRHLWISIAFAALVVLTYRTLPSTPFGDLARILGAR